MTTMPGNDITLKAKWEEIKSLRYVVTITFSKTNITKKEIEEEFISVTEEDKYFEVIEEDDEVIVIISYEDVEEAEKLVEKIERNNALKNGYIKSKTKIEKDTANILQINNIVFLSFIFLVHELLSNN